MLNDSAYDEDAPSRRKSVPDYIIRKEREMSLQNTLRALSDPIRREILDMLKGKRMSAGDIVSHFDVTGASISRHLSVLKEADLIRDKREGKFIYYELNTSVLEDIMLFITNLKGENKNDKQE
jgi:DNA-binding transcriptional ArsR family regulator